MREGGKLMRNARNLVQDVREGAGVGKGGGVGVLQGVSRGILGRLL